MLQLPWRKDIIQDLQSNKILANNDIAKLRRKVEILVIDDESLPVANLLKKSNFNINHKEDISNIKDVEGYDIILCDIRGVGKEFESSKEGAYLIKEIRTIYPGKQIIAYTGSYYDATYNEYLKFADDVIEKATPIELWVDKLDNAISKLFDPIAQWEKMRMKLLEKDVSINIVGKIESKYVKAIKKKSFDNFEKFSNNLSVSSEVREALINFILITSRLLREV
jgi:hypothetical protein